MREVPVLEQACEQDVEPLRELLELRPVVAEPDDDGARVEPAQRLEQDLDALVPDQLAVVDDGGTLPGEEGGQLLGVPFVGQPLVRIAGVRRVLARLADETSAEPKNSGTSRPQTG